MTDHLSTDELLAALDGPLGEDRLAHARACDACGTELARVEQTIAELRSAGDVPEPSPLFWNHLSQRIRAATDSNAVPRASTWLHAFSGWRSLAAAGALAVVAAFVSYRSASGPAFLQSAVTPPAISDAGEQAPGDDDSWDAVVEMASRLSADDVHAVAASGSDVPLTLNELTRQERETFVKLVDSEFGGPR